MKPQTVQKYAFLDRDGALIFEPQDTFQVDRLDQLQILPGVISGLKNLQKLGYRLVMLTNQDGLGSEKYPQKNFDLVQQRLLKIFEENGIVFEKIFVCPHFKEENCGCRKPKTGLVDEFFRTASVDLQNSFMYGDRETDRQFAENLGIRFIKADTNGPFKALVTISLKFSL